MYYWLRVSKPDLYKSTRPPSMGNVTELDFDDKEDVIAKTDTIQGQAECLFFWITS